MSRWMVRHTSPSVAWRGVVAGVAAALLLAGCATGMPQAGEPREAKARARPTSTTSALTTTTSTLPVTAHCLVAVQRRPAVRNA